ncbi:hypothetical protein CEP52_001480 [Fusarium oligoseptatum]|uniref:Uncharacterized protein n=1 Tax=Fusarium oligoseptatum TaxID=2604345 RepID=A0A428UJ21_9HYPO|nr:hypothetical protein CEP52_001480 [Fusarium oligoseptatum]
MRFSQLFTALAASATVMAASSLRCSPFPSSMIEFSSGFIQPEPPLVKPENENLSHITTGFIDNSPSKGFVRADEAFDGKLASSLFNYANVTKSGLVDNTLTTYTPGSNKPDIWRGYVNSNFPIFEKDILVKGGAVFEGLVQRKFVKDPVAAWSLMYQNAIPVTVYVDNCHVVVGYDYFSPGLRTRVINEFFNTQAKE